MDTNPKVEASALRQALIDQLKQNIPEFILTSKIEEAFRTVPRHAFLPDLPLNQVYRDDAIVIKEEGGSALSSSSQPSVMVMMLRQLGLEPGHRVLEIGAGTGYNAALMARLVGETGKVTTVDIDEDIAARARERLTEAGFGQVEVICADGGYGYEDSAPYDIFSDLRESTARRVACLRMAVWRYGDVRRVRPRHRTGREKRLSSCACEATARTTHLPKSS